MFCLNHTIKQTKTKMAQRNKHQPRKGDTQIRTIKKAQPTNTNTHNNNNNNTNTTAKQITTQHNTKQTNKQHKQNTHNNKHNNTNNNNNTQTQARNT